MSQQTDRLEGHVRQVVNDPERLRALALLTGTSGSSDADFNRLSQMAAHLFGAEIGLVTLLDTERQNFSGCFGVGEMTEASTDTSFCAHAIALPGRTETLVVLDASRDQRFADNPLVTDDLRLRFYAGAPIIVSGHKVGTVCALSASPRHAVGDADLAQLNVLAGLAGSLFTLKEEARVRARTAAALMREEWQHALTLEAGKVGSWVWDVRTGEVSCNDTFRRMYGLPESGVVRVEQVMDATLPADRPIVQAGIEASLQRGVDYSAEARVTASGRWLTMRGRVYQRDAEGNALIMMGASIDITESKLSAEQTRLLLRELNHRVKNTLAMIQSVARQTVGRSTDPKEFIEAFSGRLRTISDAHVLLADRDWSGIGLMEVVQAQLGSFKASAQGRSQVEGEDIVLPADHALGLGLILHELTTNAHRHGAWTSPEGRVEIAWTVENRSQRGLAMVWRERGGPQVRPPTERGLGMRLIERGLAKVLESNVDLAFESQGVRADIWLPLPEAVL